jgi:asparagine synthase (glutamine-hydrolysing)
MSFFACAVSLDGQPLPAFRHQVETSLFCRERRMQWQEADGFLGAAGLGHGLSHGTVARWNGILGIGAVRLDNREEIRRSTDCTDCGVSDLELAIRLLAGAGERIADRAAQLIGDFAFVSWNPTTREVIAVRDAFGVKPLYYATPTPGVVTFASRAELLQMGSEYDVQYLNDLLAHAPYDHDRTVYPGVHAVEGASVLRMRSRHRYITTFWSAYEARAREGGIRSEEDQVAAFRALFADAVRTRLDDGVHTWSHLSGGMDSSSVVSMAQWLTRSGDVPHGLQGTVSFIEPRVSGADEREYSHAVVAAYGVRNELIPHQAGWREILANPPHLDLPNRSLRTAVRDRKAAHVIRQAGSHVLLTGMGGDNLALATMFFFADWVAKGQLTRAFSEMLHRAALGRVSFWELAYKNVVLPMLPGLVRRGLVPKDEAGTTPWLSPEAARRARWSSGDLSERFYRGRVGHKYADALAASISLVRFTMSDRFGDDLLDLRHPFLHRPLVELALRLPPELCVRPHQRKWVIRAAMRGILPEAVRTRVGKGEAQGVYRWALIHDRPFIDELLREPILADLGCIDPARLRSVVSNSEREERVPDWMSSRAYMTLDIELWLQLRAGRWAAEHSQRTGSNLD